MGGTGCDFRGCGGRDCGGRGERAAACRGQRLGVPVGCANPSVMLLGCIRGWVRRVGRVGGADLAGSSRWGV